MRGFSDFRGLVVPIDGARAVTSIKDRSISAAMLASLASMPSTHRSAKLVAASASNLMD